MASEFIGYAVLVTLRSPPHAKIRGIVADVDPIDQRLLLRDVILLWSGQHVPEYSIKSHLIADLDVSPPDWNGNGSTGYVPEISHPVASTTAMAPSAQFVDPAILSYAKPTAASRDTSVPARLPVQPEAVSPIMIAESAVSLSTSSIRPGRSGPIKQSSVSSIATTLPVGTSPRVDVTKESSATATLTQPFDALALNDDVSALQEISNAQGKGSRKTKKTAAKNPRGKDGRPAAVPPRPDVGENAPSPAKGTGKGKGWRQTPLVEELPAAKVGSQKKSRHQKQRSYLEDPNGWATEDATDIQEMADFDFEENLSKFDKKAVFNDIRRDDTTADSDRLVSFNRIARPGTNGGRNLHYTENVLDPTPADVRWKSEAGETEDDVGGREEHYSSGRASRRSGSKRPAPSRKGSAFPGAVGALRTESPFSLNRSPTITSPINGSGSGSRAAFRLADSKKPCPCISPLQMLEMEQLCISELGLTEELLTENAGRSIAEAAMKRWDPLQSTGIMFLVGNHKSGARAVAAARHLRNRRLRVSVCVLGGEREDMLLEGLKKQLSLYRKGTGFIDKWTEFQTKIVNGILAPTVVVDALLAIHVAFDELRTDDQATAFEMTRWANRSGATILSIDIPSGFDAASGLATEADGERLVMESNHVVCLGAPKIGLLTAMASEAVNWQVSLVDMGISATVWSNYGSRKKHGPDFGTDWVVPLKLVTGSESIQG